MSNIINRDTVGDMARRAATKYGDKTAIIFRDVQLSFYDLERESRRFAHLMSSYGIRKGDRVAIYAYNSHYYPISCSAWRRSVRCRSPSTTCSTRRRSPTSSTTRGRRSSSWKTPSTRS
ncbi:MAG TPA: AMP-binding protein [Deltaproteobacteria bacterium]|nr:AMP-binding protein [Deltaproteobacteria bacterium]HOM29995.1 AMP-binding protein [Deltaproteobacteria bacterium]